MTLDDTSGDGGILHQLKAGDYLASKDMESVENGRLLDPWKQPYFYFVITENGSAPDISAAAYDWVPDYDEWADDGGLSHMVKIFSCGKENYDEANDRPTTIPNHGSADDWVWDAQDFKIIYKKDGG
jgi:hypothetical protein